MELDQSLELPPEIVEKLKSLELELTDGDITVKGFEKKKANLLADIPPRTQNEVDIGPEPSAADVEDFLDFLPSPTHSPTRTVEAVQYMEQNHRQIQQQSSYAPPTPNHQPQFMRPPSYRPTNYPVSTNRPYIRYSQPRPQGYYGQRPPPPPPPPQNMAYRPPSSQPRPPITSQPISTSPRPMYRPLPNTNSNNYRPQYDTNSNTNDIPTPSIKKARSFNSFHQVNPARASISSTSSHPRPVKTANKRVNLSKYGNATMAKTFQNVEPILAPRQDISTLEEFAGRQVLPTIPRDIPFKVIDIQDKQDPSLFHSMAELLRYRSQGRLIPAFTQVDDKGKEMTSLTWEKLAARAEKVAMVMRDKSSLQVGDRVALVYRKSEVTDFIVALLGCFIAGMVAVPINAIEELSELWFILRVSNVHLVLTTDNNLKTLTKNMKARNIEFPKEVDWWPTNDFGSLYSHQIRSGKHYPLQRTPLAYIEYTKSINGELKGVAVSHQSIMHQCHAFTAATTETVVFTDDEGNTSILPHYDTQGADILLTYLEPRQQLGLNISILSSIYSGSHTIFTSANIMETPSIWIYLISKYKATMALTGYPGVFYAAKYYQKNTKEVMNFSKKVTPDLSSLRFLFIDATVVKPDTNEYIANKLLKPLSPSMLQKPIEVVTPILSLPEHAGAIVSFRDYLGPSKLEELEISYNQQDNTTTTRKNITFAPGKSRDVWECILDADALRRKKIVVLATTKSDGITGGDEAGCLKVGSHGFPFPLSTVAIVDPETSMLCPPDTIGEIWMDGPSLADGFWGIPGLTDVMYHARPVLIPSENLHLEVLDQQFVRTGLLGTMIGGRMVVLGTFEERIRQQRLGQEFGLEEVHLASDVLNTITKKTRIDSCTMFDIYVNGQYLPILAIESNATTEDIKGMVDSLCDVVMAFHGLRLYAVVAVNKGQLPRYLKDGNQYIHHLMTKKHFLSGRLPVKYLKMDVDRTIFNEASSITYLNDPSDMTIWQSNIASYERALMMKIISPRIRAQHTGIEMIHAAFDERSSYDLSRFTNIVDIMLWRTSLYPEENAFVGFSQGSTKPYTWRRFNNRIATITNFFIKKCALKPTTPVMVLMHFGTDLVRTLYACFVAGIIPILCPPPEVAQNSQKRIQDDVNLMVRTIHDLKIQYLIVNSQSEDVLKHKTIQAAIKITTTYQGKLINLKRLPDQINIDKAPRFNKQLGPESGYSVKSEWTADKQRPALVLIQQNPTDDHLSGSHQYIPYTHDTILNQCRAQKLTCQIKFQKPLIVTGFNGFESLGLLQGVFCGVYVGCTTILIPSLDFRNNTLAYFELMAKNKCPTVLSNYLLFDYTMARITPNDQRQIPLHHAQNVMLSVTSRTKPKFFERIARQLSLSRVERESISTVYTHAFNPMITTRSYMCVEPIPLIADLEWLRQGIIRPLAQTDESAYGVLLHDSGIVPTNTMIAIVNPEKQVLCPSHVIGEIWVSSDSNVKGLYGNTKYDPSMFEATIPGSDQKVKYMRTGDIGFLWNVHRKTMGTQPEEGQCLYVLGHMSEIIHTRGLIHFSVDIEETVETCHPDILAEGCYVIQTESKEIIVIIAIKPNNGSSLYTVPIIVSSILERHALLIDTIVMVNKDQLPKKNNGEKLRKIVLSRYTRKEMSAISVTRVKNQHQPINLPQWHNTNTYGSMNVDNSDNQSVISFSQRSHMNFETADTPSIDRQPVPTIGSNKSRKSAGAESVWE